MPYAQFGEREYETAANAELSLAPAPIFSPDQVLEGVLGFDAAISVPSLAAWSMLRTQAPRGIQLVPGLLSYWKGVPSYRLPTYAVSLILQYKRPLYRTAKNAPHRKHWNGSYYEFLTRARHHSILRDLETAVGSDALVRYSSPAFWMAQELFGHQVNTRVVQNSAFASPLAIASTHKKWTYASPGTTGLANPDPERTAADSWETLAGKLADQASETTIEGHLLALVRRILPDRQVVDGPSVLEDALMGLQVRREKLPCIAALLTLSNYFSREGLDWFVVAFQPHERREISLASEPLPWRWYRR